MVPFPSQPATCMPSANNPCHVHRKLIDDGEFVLGEAARVGVKRPALDDCSLPPRDPSSLKSISRKRRRIGFLPALASISFFDFPYVKTSCHRDDEDRRALVYQTAPHLRPLWELDSIDDFEDCYIDIVETHFRAYEHGVLHRDISDETVLVHKPNGKAAGCLVDWDLACCPDYRGDGEALRRGAGPFVAIDLQYVRSNGKLEPQAHHYHHDLESLFWLLAWALMHFDIPNGRRLDCKLPSWGTGTWSEAALFKSCFILEDCHTMRDYLRGVLPHNKDTVLDWVIPLAKMFGNARRAATSMLSFATDAGAGSSEDEVQTVKFDTKLYAMEATLEKFMGTIQRKPRMWS